MVTASWELCACAMHARALKQSAQRTASHRFHWIVLSSIPTSPSFARGRGSSPRCRMKGASTMRPSTVKAPTPFSAAARAASTTRSEMRDLLVCRPEHLVRERDLRGMDAALADVPEAARHFRLGDVAGLVLEVRVRAVVAPGARFAGGDPHVQQDARDHVRVVAVDVERLDEIP
jgi:hypothetical protein